MSIDPVSLAITAALTMASMAMTAMQRFKGPRLEDLEVTLADYGAPIPRVWGKRKVQPQIIWAERLNEREVTSKTKGGKFDNYEYDGTWAVLVTDTPIDAYMKIWFDKHLVFQSTDAGPISPLLELIPGPFGIDVKLGVTNNMRMYYGTETQLPDPRYEAWCEDRYGPDSAPAFRGSSYIVFESIPLEKFGNRIPQVTVEFTRGVEDAFIYEQRTGAYGDIDGITPSFTRLWQIAGDQYLTWDLPNRQLLMRRTLNAPISERIGTDDGGFYALSGGFVSPEVWRFGLDGDNGTSLLNVDFTGMAPFGVALKGGLLCFYTANTNEEYQIVGYAPAMRFDCGFSPTHYFETIGGFLGGTWCVGTQAGDLNLGIAPVPSANGTIFATGGGGAVAMDNGQGHFLIFHDSTLFLYDPSTDTMVDTAAVAPVDFDIAFTAFDSVPPGSAFIWIGTNKYDTRTLELIDTITLSDWVAETPLDMVYDPVSNAMVSLDFTGTILTWRHLDRVDSTGMTLGAVVDEVSDWVGLTGQDTTALTQIVYGYSVTQAPAKDMIAPLLTLHDVDPRPHDFSVQFVNRGGSPVGTILTGDFASDGDNRYKVTIQQDTDLPRRVTFTYADGDKDQQPNTVIAQRPLDAMDSNREESIDLSTYVEYPATAQQMADRYLRREWNSRETIENALTVEKIGLEPADVTTISLDGVLRNVRLNKMTLRGMAIDCEFVRDETAFAVLNSSTGAPMDGRDPEVIFVPSLTKGFILDTPLITDSDNDINPILYVGAGKYTGGWPGAVINRGDDGTYDEQVTGVVPASGATWGIASDALPTADANVWDRGNTFNITAFGGTLTGATEAEIDADPLLNLCAFGGDGRWELMQFTTATLEVDDTYTISGLKRGRRGTEWAVGLHAMGDLFVMVDNLIPIEMGTDDIGDAISYKAQSVGRSIESGARIDLTYTGASLKPYAPAVQAVTKDPTTGDILIEFDRRSRIGANWNGTAVPLGEATEAYELDILDAGDVVNTLTSTTPSITYTSAAQTTDLGAPIEAEDLDAMLYQMSATVGRGYAATI